MSRTRRRKQHDNGVGQRRAAAVADHVAGEHLREGKIGDAEVVGLRRKMPRRTGKFIQIISDEVLHEIAVGKVPFRGDLAVDRAVRVAGNIAVRDRANDHARLAVRQVELLHHHVSSVNHAVGVGIQKFLDDHRVSARQAGDLQRDHTGVSVADGVGCDGEDGGAQSHRANARKQRCHEK